MTVVLKGGELEVVGPAGLVVMRRLPLYRVNWVNEGPVTLMGKNGRPRNKVTLPGHGKGIKPPNTGKRYPPEPLTDEEVLRILAVIPTSHAAGAPNRTGIRDKALITLLWRTGLRVSEALDLRPHHVDMGTQRVLVLNGKGGKTRTVGIDMGGLFALQPWLFERAMLGVHAMAPLFCSVQRPGVGNRLYSAYVRHKLHEYGAAAGVPKRVHPHGFRHSIACSLIQEDFGLTDVQAQLGHSSPATTAIYLRGLGADKAFAKVAERAWPGGAR